jgi:hypothetical protein
VYVRVLVTTLMIVVNLIFLLIWEEVLLLSRIGLRKMSTIN